MNAEALCGLLEPFFRIMSVGEKVVAKRVSDSVFSGLIQRWSEFIDVDPSSSKSAAFDQRQKFVLDLSKIISAKLFALATNADITSTNRTILYNCRIPFESGINQLGNNLKKRKIGSDPSDTKSSQKRKLDIPQKVVEESKKRKLQDITTNAGNGEDKPSKSKRKRIRKKRKATTEKPENSSENQVKRVRQTVPPIDSKPMQEEEPTTQNIPKENQNSQQVDDPNINNGKDKAPRKKKKKKTKKASTLPIVQQQKSLAVPTILDKQQTAQTLPTPLKVPETPIPPPNPIIPQMPRTIKENSTNKNGSSTIKKQINLKTQIVENSQIKGNFNLEKNCEYDQPEILSGSAMTAKPISGILKRAPFPSPVCTKRQQQKKKRRQRAKASDWF